MGIHQPVARFPTGVQQAESIGRAEVVSENEYRPQPRDLCEPAAVFHGSIDGRISGRVPTAERRASLVGPKHFRLAPNPVRVRAGPHPRNFCPARSEGSLTNRRIPSTLPGVHQYPIVPVQFDSFPSAQFLLEHAPPQAPTLTGPLRQMAISHNPAGRKDVPRDNRAVWRDARGVAPYRIPYRQAATINLVLESIRRSIQ